MRLPTFNGPFITWNYFINFMSNGFNPPYIMPQVGEGQIGRVLDGNPLGELQRPEVQKSAKMVSTV